MKKRTVDAKQIGKKVAKVLIRTALIVGGVTATFKGCDIWVTNEMEREICQQERLLAEESPKMLLSDHSAERIKRYENLSDLIGKLQDWEADKILKTGTLADFDETVIRGAYGLAYREVLTIMTALDMPEKTYDVVRNIQYKSNWPHGKQILQTYRAMQGDFRPLYGDSPRFFDAFTSFDDFGWAGLSSSTRQKCCDEAMKISPNLYTEHPLEDFLTYLYPNEQIIVQQKITNRGRE